MPHWLVALGSIVGLITGIYTLVEKVLKQRPSAWTTRANARHDNMLVRVRNRADQDIALVGYRVRPPIYMISNSEHLDSIWDASSEDQSYRLIRPEGVADLPLIPRFKDGRAMDNDDRRFWIFVFWRRTGSMWLPRIPLLLRMRTSQITRLSGAEVDASSS
jgi:hypothetical protein